MLIWQLAADEVMVSVMLLAMAMTMAMDELPRCAVLCSQLDVLVEKGNWCLGSI